MSRRVNRKWVVTLVAWIVLLGSLTVMGCALPSSPGQDDASLYVDYMQQERDWAGLTSHRVDVGGFQMSYSHKGHPGRPTLILVHGFSGDRNHWNRLAHALGDRYQLFIPDLPGHGDSEALPAADYSQAELADALRAFVDALQLEQYVLVGHSMGGALAVQWGMYRPGQLLGMVLIDAAGLYHAPPTPLLARLRRGEPVLSIQQPGDLARVLALATHQPPFIPTQVRASYESYQMARAPVYDAVMDAMLTYEQQVPVASYDMALKAIHAPVLILWGEHDQVFSVTAATELQQRLPAADLVILPDIGHTPILEAPQATAQFMIPYLERLAAPEGNVAR